MAQRAGHPPASSSQLGLDHLIGYPCTLWSTP